MNLNHGIRQGQIGPVTHGVVHMAPANVVCSRFVVLAEQMFYFGFALHRDGLRPELADPFLAAQVDHVFADQGQIADHAFVVEDEHHVGGGGHQFCGGICVQTSEELACLVKRPVDIGLRRL